MSLGIKFNPSDNSLVAQIKQKSAELIDLCDNGQRQRLKRGRSAVGARHDPLRGPAVDGQGGDLAIDE